MNKDTLVVVPAYNEADRITAVLLELSRYFSNILVIDDCSTDETAKKVKNIDGILLAQHPINLGQGASLQTGFDFAKSRNFDFVITFDSDGQHQVQDATNMIAKFKELDCDVMCGSRFIGQNSVGMPRSRRVLLKMATFFTLITSGVKVTDAHNGLRVFSSKSLEYIEITQNRMAHASEIINMIGKYKLRYTEYPVTIVYSPETLAKGQKATGALNILMDLISERISKF